MATLELINRHRVHPIWAESDSDIDTNEFPAVVTTHKIAVPSRVAQEVYEIWGLDGLFGVCFFLVDFGEEFTTLRPWTFDSRFQWTMGYNLSPALLMEYIDNVDDPFRPTPLSDNPLVVPHLDLFPPVRIDVAKVEEDPWAERFHETVEAEMATMLRVVHAQFNLNCFYGGFADEIEAEVAALRSATDRLTDSE
jgi:hypothetical protein